MINNWFLLDTSAGPHAAQNAFEQVVEIERSETGDTKVSRWEPSSIEFEITGSNDAILHVFSGPNEQYGDLGNGIYCKKSVPFSIDFPMGIYKLRFESVSGNTQVRLNAIGYIKIGEVNG